MLQTNKNEEWAILAEEASLEQDPKKLMELIASLTQALDEKDAKQNGYGSNRSAA